MDKLLKYRFGIDFITNKKCPFCQVSGYMDINNYEQQYTCGKCDRVLEPELLNNTFEVIRINGIEALFIKKRIRTAIQDKLYVYNLRPNDNNDGYGTIEESVWAKNAATIITLEPLPLSPEHKKLLVDKIDFIGYEIFFEDWLYKHEIEEKEEEDEL